MTASDVFLSHSYGPDNVHHDLVAQISRELRALQSPKIPWLDESNLPYAVDMESTFENAIDSTRCFFLFLTQEYQEKVFDHKRAFNWCRYEYRAAINMNKPLLVILLDPALQDPRTSWCRSMQIHHADRLYFDMSDPAIFDNPQLLREKCILLGRILDELQTHGDMTTAINTVLPNKDNCPIHNEVYEYYDTESHQVICRHCAATRHEGRQKVTISEKARQIRENDLLIIQQRLMNIIDDYNQRATILMERRESDLEKRNNYHNQIHGLFQQMRDAITKTENRMITAVQTQHNHQQITVDQLHTQTLENQQQTQSLLNNLNHPATNVSLVKTWIQAKNTQTEITEMPHPFSIELPPNFLSEEFNLIQEKLQDCCKISQSGSDAIVNPTLSVSDYFYFIFKGTMKALSSWIRLVKWNDVDSIYNHHHHSKIVK